MHQVWQGQPWGSPEEIQEGFLDATCELKAETFPAG